jgi:hypothetical protein
MESRIYLFISYFSIGYMSLSTAMCQPAVTNGTFNGTTTGWNDCGLTGPEVGHTEDDYGGTSSTDYVAEIDNGDSKGLCQTISGFTSGASASLSDNLYIYYQRRTQGFAPTTVTLNVCLIDPNDQVTASHQTCTTISDNGSTWGAYNTLNWNYATPLITSGTSLILKITQVASNYTPGSATCPNYDCSPPAGQLCPTCNNNYGMVVSYIGFTPTPTPVTLVNFTAVKNKSAVDLDWQTATEINNDYFIVEKSRNGTDFTTVGIVDGAGNSQSTLNYQTTDHLPYNGISYYRLKQTDFDAKVSYSKIEAVNFNENKNISVYPNPNTGIFNIQGLNAEAEISVQNPLGQVVLIKKVSSNSSEIDLSNQPSGVYFLKVSEGDTSVNTKIILHR